MDFSNTLDSLFNEGEIISGNRNESSINQKQSTNRLLNCMNKNIFSLLVVTSFFT